jgi:hypothetical protein
VLVVGYFCYSHLNCRFLATDAYVVGRGCRQRACIPLLLDCFNFVPVLSLLPLRLTRHSFGCCVQVIVGWISNFDVF